jgi:hypothetical protein
MSLSVDWLRDRIASYFEANGIPAPVVYGTEKDAQHKDTLARVVVGLQPGPGSFQLIPAGEAGAPGHSQIGPGVAARPIATKRQRVFIAIRATAPPTEVKDRVRVSQELASDLLDDVIRAIHEPAHGSHGFNVDGGGEWVDVQTADAANGAMIKLRGWIDIPVLDRPRPRIGLAKPSAPSVTGVNPGLELDACDSTHCETVVATT